MAGQTRGFNPQFGWDGPAEFYNQFAGGMPHGTFAGPGCMMNPGAYPYSGMQQAMSYHPQQSAMIPPAGAGQGPAYVMPANGYQHPVPTFPGQHPRYPQPHPVVNINSPSANLANSTGGAGCEPGYNYFFPSEHTKIHVIKSPLPPWRAPTNQSLNYGAYHVPTRVTLGELLVGFGATNPTAKMNKVTEVLAGGNGKWYKGLTFSGDEKEEMSKTLKEAGWDSSRTGRSNEKPVVWLWITKD